MIDVPDAAPPAWSVSSLGNVIVLICAWVMYLSSTICWSTYCQRALSAALFDSSG